VEHTEIRAVVFDLDGVVRHYDRDHEADIEVRFGLEPGSLLREAFGGDIGDDLMCGRIDHAEFVVRLGAVLGSVDAAQELADMRAEVDPDAVRLVQHLQTQLPVALLTNGSRRTRVELEEQGLAGVFDHVFNAAELGVAKPSPRIYRHVLEVLGVGAPMAVFVDDHLPNVEGARAVGMVGHHYRGLDELVGFLDGLGLDVAPRLD